MVYIPLPRKPCLSSLRLPFERGHTWCVVVYNLALKPFDLWTIGSTGLLLLCVFEVKLHCYVTAGPTRTHCMCASEKCMVCLSIPAPSDILQHAVYAMELNVEECGDVYTALAELKQVQCAWCVGACVWGHACVLWWCVGV